jgi:hypothetical protein
MLNTGRVFHRNAGGEIVGQSRAEFARTAASGEVNSDTLVFDTSVTTAAAYRSAFEKPARDSWHAELLSTTRILDSRF